jgi:hypothetical protein
MDVLDSVRSEWSKSRKLSPIQRVIAGIFSIVSLYLFFKLSVNSPIGYILASIPISLFLLGVSGGPVKKILGAALASSIGLIVGNLL